MSKRGSLVVVGTGIKLGAQATLEARQWIESAERVLHVVADGPVARWIEKLNANAESLNDLYAAGKPRLQTYMDMVDAILNEVRARYRVCAVFYGHPGVFVYPSHEAVAQAREEGYRAWMTPGVSAEDCLFADIGVDPASQGCQSYEATNFLLRKRRFDPCAALILWQIGVIGDASVREPKTFNEGGLSALIRVLAEHYESAHEVIVYEAAQWPICAPRIQCVALSELQTARISPLSTLYVPPKTSPPRDEEMFQRLGIERDLVGTIRPRPFRAT